MRLYRGDGANRVGHYWSLDKEWARQFTHSGLDSEIREIDISNNKILIMTPLPSANSESDISMGIKKADIGGYAGFMVSEGKGQPNSIFLLQPHPKINKSFLESCMNNKFTTVANIKESIHNILFEDEVPESIQDIDDDPETSYRYAIKLNGRGEDIPKEIIQSISKAPHFAYFYATVVLKGKNVPPEIIGGISGDSKVSYEYATVVLKGKNVPPEIIKSISVYSKLSYEYATVVLKGKNVPPEIIKSISKDVDSSYLYATEALKGENVPEPIIIRILQSFDKTYDYAKYLIKIGKDIPPLIIHVLRSLNNPIYSAAAFIWNNESPPIELIQSISKNVKLSYEYASTVLNGKDVPDQIINTLRNSSDHLHNISSFIWNNEPAPIELIQSISKNEKSSYQYASTVLKWQNVPQEIIQSIFKYRTSFNFIEDLPNKNEIIDIIKDNKNFVRYYLNPKKLAEQYNNQMSGLIMHATNLKGFNMLVNMQIQDNWGEICVATLDSDVIPLNRNLCMLGQADIRLLFDFDCYSRIAEEDNKRRRYATKPQDVDLEKSKMERVETDDSVIDDFGDMDVGVKVDMFIGSKYYDEGFAQAKDINWLAYVDVNDEYENTDDQYLKQLKRITKAEFDQLLKSGQIIKYLYDLLHKDDDTHKDDYSDIEDKLLVRENDENTTVADIKESIHNILFDS